MRHRLPAKKGPLQPCFSLWVVWMQHRRVTMLAVIFQIRRQHLAREGPCEPGLPSEMWLPRRWY